MTSKQRALNPSVATDLHRATVRRFKGLDGTSASEVVPIVDDQGSPAGALQPIDIALAAEPSTAQRLTRWRQASMQYFLTQFQATEERTANWLLNVIIPSDSQLLLLVEDEARQPIGTLGLCNLASGRAEIDNVNRGEAGGHKRLMYFALASLIHWLYRAVHVQEVFLRVLSNNTRAIGLYDKVGFRTTASSPLRRRQTPDTLIFEVIETVGSTVEDDTAQPRADFDLLTMTLNRDEFYRRQPWLQAAQA